MKINLYCKECKQYSCKGIEVNNVGFYEGTCDKGHSVKNYIQQQLFEILFEIGVFAIRDGYYREAISSFTASLERFYEFYIKLICVKNAIDQNQVDFSWKEINNQSERQLGAFVFTYLQEHRTSPTILDAKSVQLRNQVIHKGKIPSKKESVEYGNKIITLIDPVLDNLKLNYDKYLTKTVFTHYDEMHKISKDSDVYLLVDTVISVAWAAGKRIDIETALKNIKLHGKSR